MKDIALLGSQRPRIAPWFSAYAIANEGLYLIAERQDGVLKGDAFLTLAPYLDGRLTTDEIIDRVADKLSAADVYYAITLAAREGYLTCDPPVVDLHEERFWGAFGVPPADAHRALSANAVSPISIGRLDVKIVAQALRDANLSLSADGLDVVITDDYLDPRLAHINDAHLASGKSWMLGKLDGTVLWFGPVFTPTASACWACLAQRISANREVSSYVRWKRGSSENPCAPTSRLPTSITAAASLFAFAVVRHLLHVDEPHRLATLDLLSYELKHHVVVRRPQCSACGNPQLAQRHVPIELRSGVTVLNADGTRTMAPEETVERLNPHVSPISGAVTELVRMSDSNDSTMHVYYAGHNFAVRSRDLRYLKEGLRSKSSGKGSSDAQARASALCEALERYSGIFQGDEPRIRASYRMLGDEAVHPNASMLFSEKQYDEQARWLERDSRFAVVPLRFDETVEVEWTSVWSMTSSCWKYLPTGYLYYGYPHHQDQFYYWADSNGNAAGNTLEEAILQGFLEIVERDAVCLWWYNRLSRPSVDLASFDDPWIARVAERYEQLARPMWVLDVTSDLGIPTFVAVSARIDKPVEDMIFACGAHLDPRIAIHRAIAELNQFLPAVLPIATDGSGNYQFPDPDCQQWWRTATRANQPYMAPDPRTTPRRRGDFATPPNDDLRDNILFCRRLVESRGMEMLVLDQSRPDLEIQVAKVVVPGLRHFWARLGPGRLYDVPVQQHWLERPMLETELNPIALFL